MVMSLAALGCSRESSGGGGGGGRTPLGTERNDCRADKTCNAGLLCLSNVCVRPPPADCQAIADQLASLELGNYAEPEQRAPVVATYRANCDKAYVSKEQGACIEKATDKWGAAQCAPLMFPEMAATAAGGDCTSVVAKTRTTMAQSMGNVADPTTQQMLALVMKVMQESCEQDAWPDMLKKCILLGAPTTDAMNACNQHMPPALAQKLQERMSSASMEQQMAPPQ